MIPAAFEYQVADSADAAIAALAEHGDDAKLLAGGHSLIPLMRFRLNQAPRVKAPTRVAISKLPALG